MLEDWRGAAYGDLATEAFVRAEAARLDEVRLAAEEDLIGAELVLGRHVERVGRLEQLVAEYPYRERLWGHLTLALYRSGRQADALRAVQRVRPLLRDELGIEPGQELMKLEAAILRHEPGLDWVSSIATATPAAATRRHHLPAPLTEFVGRVDELPQVATMLSSGRLVTLTGAGGVGKTRLAVEAARRASPDYPDGAWVVELAPVSDEAGVVGTLTSALGVSVTGVQDAVLAQVVYYLAGRHALLVVDNCEHVIGAAARTVARLLAACPRLTILATSREVLRVPGEIAYPVGPLGLPPEHSADLRALEGSEAVTLFCDRLREVQPIFRLSDADAASLARICRRLDGIPSALELAAARARVMTLSQIAARLDDCLALLQGGARTALPRQQTLRADRLELRLVEPG